ncbi:DMT superfamily efflux pump [Psychrobacter arcticus 273-4]|uniref:DMT superfamily efflux pump n=1 Tax=Psychrobacter arcticus (strain DSM 17307 / VKM B-2377 / 273-4) TaxID=259536 RepID=Q4FSV5_PSYA2|nr:DMT family transporter [Psychrobacter arcticus]AAZ18903.1 DMT superfamily efflux pump [Psychrobacter arcticus 273-4]
MASQAYYLRHRASKIGQPFDNRLLSEKGSWLSSISLVIYALCFSVAYVELETGTGALILFSAVQLTMIGWGIYKKETLSHLQWIAFVVAIAGFVYLMLPSAAMPSLLAAMLMAISGVAWGIYSIRGKICLSPLRATGFNFIRSLVAIPILLFTGFIYQNIMDVQLIHLDSITMEGIWLACASGAVTSGIGYSIWYMAMPLLKNTQAAVIQLCVPVLAALLGVVILSEPMTLTFIVVSAVILSSVLVFILNKQPY